MDRTWDVGRGSRRSAAILALLVAFADPGWAAADDPEEEDEIILLYDDPPQTTEAPAPDLEAAEPEAPSRPLLGGLGLRARARLVLDARLGLDLRFDREGEQIVDALFGARLELELELSRTLTAYAAPWVGWIGALERDGTDRSLLLSLPPEAFVRWRSGPISVRAGNLVFAWGSSDLIAPSDVLNPLDLRRGGLGLAEGVKIPILAGEVVASLGPLTLRGVAAPFFTPSRFFLVGWDYALANGAIPGSPSVNLDGLVGRPTVDHLGDQVVLTDRPPDRPDSATLAARATLHLGDLDVSATAVHGWDALPRVILDPDLLIVLEALGASARGQEESPLSDPEVVDALVRVERAVDRGQTLFKGSYARRNLIGVDATWALDPIVLKVDVAYTFGRTLYTQGFRPITLPWLNAVLGAEYVRGEDLQITAELFALTILDIPSNQRLLYFEAMTPPPSSGPEGRRTISVPGAAAAVRYALLDGDLALQLAVAHTFTRGDWVLLPRVAWRVAAGHELSLGAVWIEGHSDGYGGVYGNTDQVFVAYRCSM